MPWKKLEEKKLRRMKEWGLEELPPRKNCADTIAPFIDNMEIAFEFEKKRAGAQVKLGTVNGLWTFGIDAKGRDWGHSYLPSIMDKPITTREEALRVGIEACLLNYTEKHHHPLRPEEKAVQRALEDALKPKQGELF